MHQCRALECVAGPFPLQLPSRDLAELLIDQRDQFFERGLIARFPAHQKLGHRLEGLLRHAR